MPVTDKNKKYEYNIYKWRLVRDVCKGAFAVKTAQDIENKKAGALGNEPGTMYLPPPNPADDSIENRMRYQAYRNRAIFVNFTGHTKDALVGMVFRKDPIIELPTLIEEIKDDANGKGESLTSMMKRSVDEVLQTGRQGLLTDFPVMPESVSLAESADIYPFIKQYTAESIINWRSEYKDGKVRLCMVVLKEENEIFEDEFTSECKDMYRALLLNEQGYYIQRLYDEDGELLGVKNEDDELITDIMPLKADGKPFTEIPFEFIGAINNDDEPDSPPLYDQAEVNLGHYRNSADYEESCFMVGQPTPVIAGVTQGWLDDVLNGRVEIGSRGAIPLPEGGSATLLQAAPNQMPSEAMVMKEKQMIQIGAKIITDSGQAETAEAAKIRFAGQNSKLGTLVNNVQDAYTNALYFAMDFAGAPDAEIELELNTEFYDKTVDPQLLMAKIQLMDRGVIAASDVRDHLRKLGEISEERSDDEIDQELGANNLFGALGTLE